MTCAHQYIMCFFRTNWSIFVDILIRFMKLMPCIIYGETISHKRKKRFSKWRWELSICRFIYGSKDQGNDQVIVCVKKFFIQIETLCTFCVCIMDGKTNRLDKIRDVWDENRQKMKRIIRIKSSNFGHH